MSPANRTTSWGALCQTTSMTPPSFVRTKRPTWSCPSVQSFSRGGRAGLSRFIFLGELALGPSGALGGDELELAIEEHVDEGASVGLAGEQTRAVDAVELLGQVGHVVGLKRQRRAGVCVRERELLAGLMGVRADLDELVHEASELDEGVAARGAGLAVVQAREGLHLLEHHNALLRRVLRVR